MRKYLVFDLDGTLLNTITDLTNAVNHALTAFGLPTHGEDAIVRMVGNGIRVLVERATLGGEGHPDFEAIFAAFTRYYEAHKSDNTAPYDGVQEMLHALAAAGYTLAIASNKIDSAVKALWQELFADTVALALGESDTVARKPAPDMVEAALSTFGAEKADAYYIGDSEVDVATAKNSGLPCLSVLWGFRSEEELRAVGADTFFKTPADLTAYLLNEVKQ